MAPTPEQRSAFGHRLAELRVAAGLVQREVVQALAEHGGHAVTGSACSEWERGLSSPDAENAAALERLFGEPAGSLAGMLGFRGDDPGTAARLGALEEAVAAQSALLRQILDRLDRVARG